MFRSRTLPVFVLCAGLAACSVPTRFNAYKIDVQQGNVLSQEMVAQLKPGQSRDQVRFILGTPLLTDIFHQQRWDYVYRYHDGQTGSVEQRKLSVFFDQNNQLERVAGDVGAAAPEDLSAPSSKNRVVDLGSLGEGDAAKPMPPPEGRGFFGTMRDWVGL
jgi:outer membrane protein assembly factor BamE